MNKMDGYKQQASLIRALAHPTRLRILEILAQHESCVCHLTAILMQRQPYVSQQLMVLRAQGLVLDRKDGVMVYYRLADLGIAKLISLTRDLLRASGTEVDFPTVPQAPLRGCSCPLCARWSS